MIIASFEFLIDPIESFQMLSTHDSHCFTTDVTSGVGLTQQNHGVDSSRLIATRENLRDTFKSTLLLVFLLLVAIFTLPRRP